VSTEETGRATIARESVSWTGAVIVSALALAALYIGTAVVVSVVQWTAKGVLGATCYYGLAVIAPLVIGGRRSRGASVPVRVRRIATLSFAAQLIFLPVALAAMAM
jgi:hypothetical protein